MHRFTLVLATGAALSLAALACSEPSAPKGIAGSIAARAFIDRDASGTYGTADSALVGVPIVLTQGGAPVATQNTGAGGLATFTGVAPGSYQLSAPAAAVTGGVLTGNVTPSVAVSFQGKANSVDFAYAFYPGVVSGRIFRDDNANGAFDATDTPGKLLKVYLRRDASGAAGATIDSVVSAADGTYQFARVAPGSYFVQFQNPGNLNYGVAGDTRKVSVAPLGTVTLTPLFTGSLAAPIRNARTAAAGTVTTVAGTLTVAPGAVVSGTNGVNSEIWVQDASGGIAVFSVLTADSTKLLAGDLVEVSGTVGANFGQLQLSTSPIVAKIGTSTMPAPKVQTGASVNAKTDDGLLVSLAGFTVTVVGTASATGAFNVTGTAADGQTVTVRVSSALKGLSRANFVVGSTYTVVGILSQNGAVAQVKVRTRSVVTP